jgi:hypothetical protein
MYLFEKIFRLHHQGPGVKNNKQSDHEYIIKMQPDPCIEKIKSNQVPI